MGIDATQNRLRKDFPIRGEFTLSPNDSVNDVVVREGVPEGYGVYIISGIQGSTRQVIYVGRAGTILQDGTFKEQGLRRRLTRKQNNLPRKIFFREAISERSLDGLHFEWFVTYGEGSKVPPFLVEAQLLAGYLSEHGTLPELNKEA